MRPECLKSKSDGWRYNQCFFEEFGRCRLFCIVVNFNWGNVHVRNRIHLIEQNVHPFTYASSNSSPINWVRSYQGDCSWNWITQIVAPIVGAEKSLTVDWPTCIICMKALPLSVPNFMLLLRRSSSESIGILKVGTAMMDVRAPQYAAVRAMLTRDHTPSSTRLVRNVGNGRSSVQT